MRTTLVVAIVALVLLVGYQGRVIQQQRDVIRSMVTNPYGGNDD